MKKKNFLLSLIFVFTFGGMFSSLLGMEVSETARAPKITSKRMLQIVTENIVTELITSFNEQKNNDELLSILLSPFRDLYESIFNKKLYEKIKKQIPDFPTEEKLNCLLKKIDNQDTLLHILAKTGLHKSLDLLLSKISCPESKNIIIDSKNSLLQTPLHIAAQNGNLLTAETLLKHGKNSINAQDIKGNTALIIASEKGYKDLVDLLLNNGATTDLTNQQGETALWKAAVKFLYYVTQLKSRLNYYFDDEKNWENNFKQLLTKFLELDGLKSIICNFIDIILKLLDFEADLNINPKINAKNTNFSSYDFGSTTFCLESLADDYNIKCHTTRDVITLSNIIFSFCITNSNKIQSGIQSKIKQPEKMEIEEQF